jgi:hypothetical protein
MAMHEAPSGGLAAKQLRDAERLGEDRTVLQTRVVALDRHDAGEAGADDHAEIFFFDTAARKLGGRPIKTRLGFGPSTLEAAEAAEDGDVVGVGIEALQRLRIALDEFAIGSDRFGPRDGKGFPVALASSTSHDAPAATISAQTLARVISYFLIPSHRGFLKIRKSLRVDP